LGLPDNTSFPISGCDCKEDDYEVIGRASLSIPAGTWQVINVEIDDQKNQDYNYIMFGLSCSRPINNRRNYLLVDDLNLVEGDLNCPSECFSINADTPPCNSDINSESDATYTYNFSFTNNTTESFDKLLVFDNDGQFALQEDKLLQLPSMLGPGQSVDLSWDIDAMTSFSEETMTYCFELAPYTHGGACCKDQHCVELTNCCPADIPPTKSTVMQDTEDCCYSFGYETCQEDYIVIADFAMITEGLDFSATASDGYQINTFSDRTFSLTMEGGAFLTAGAHEDVLQFCVDGMNSMSPEEQHFTVTWRALIEDGTQVIGVDTCALNCPIPPDQCAELINPELYCDENGIYHYRFEIKNVNDRELDASIAVLGPQGSTVPADFSQATFPDFPDHTPDGDEYL